MDSVLAKLSAMEGMAWDDLFGDDDEEEEEFTSPIDEVDELLYFAESFQALQQSLPADQQPLLASAMQADQQQQLQQLLAHVPQRANEIAQKKALEATAKANGSIPS
uniref:Uncharacterized protein n=2 Tax=Hemiselmis andersenii TaxID=464988 RepID=A0A6U2ERP4_HEMAN